MSPTLKVFSFWKDGSSYPLQSNDDVTKTGKRKLKTNAKKKKLEVTFHLPKMQMLEFQWKPKSHLNKYSDFGSIGFALILFAVLEKCS